MGSSITPEKPQLPHKSTLYCTHCRHASRINGDWVIHVHGDYLAYECPECGTKIDSRRDRRALTAQSGGSLQFVE